MHEIMLLYIVEASSGYYITWHEFHVAPAYVF